MAKTNGNGRPALPSNGVQDNFLRLMLKASPTMAYGIVAEQIRAYLPAADADVIAPWFDRLAAHEDPAKIFPRKKAGRPLGSTKVPRPADITIALIVHQSIQRAELAPRKIYEGVAKAHGITSWKNVRNIYLRHKRELPGLPDARLIDNSMAQQDVRYYLNGKLLRACSTPSQK
jgi:hypothetical protein